MTTGGWEFIGILIPVLLGLSLFSYVGFGGIVYSTTYSFLLNSDRPLYWRGYPRRMLWEHLYHIAYTLMFIGPLLLVALIGMVLTSIVFFAEKNLLSLFFFGLTTVLFFLLGYWLIVSLLQNRVAGRVVLYFKSFLKVDVFTKGSAVAKNCEFLDKDAKSLGIRGLSDFGFNDDFLGEKLDWFDPNEGVEAFSLLIDKVEKSTESYHRRDELLQDLQDMLDALLLAQKEGVYFCLIFRYGADELISPMEMDERTGSFW